MKPELTPAEQALRDAALEYHRTPTRGKISVTPTKPLSNQRDLSLAYSPGVAYACLAIEQDPALAAEYTSRGNLVGAITAAVIREPVHRVRGLLIVKTPLDALEHRLAIAGIDCKGDTNALSVPAIAVRRPVIRQRSIGRQELGIIRLLVSPLRATPFAKTRVKLTTRDAERVGDCLHSEPASSNNGNREISFSHRQLLQLLGEPRSPASSYPKPAQVAVCASRGR